MRFEKKQPAEKNSIDADTLAQIRDIMAEKIDSSLPNKEMAKQLRAGEKIPWSVVFDEFLIGTLLNQIRITDQRLIDEARSLIFSDNLADIKNKIDNIYRD